jgi:hypothetical protein
MPLVSWLLFTASTLLTVGAAIVVFQSGERNTDELSRRIDVLEETKEIEGE